MMMCSVYGQWAQGFGLGRDQPESLPALRLGFLHHVKSNRTLLRILNWVLRLPLRTTVLL